MISRLLERGRRERRERHSQDKMAKSQLMHCSTEHDSWYVANFNNYFFSPSPPPILSSGHVAVRWQIYSLLENCLGSYIRLLNGSR